MNGRFTHGSPPGGGALTDHDHSASGSGGALTLYGALADAETWAALQTFSAGLKMGGGQIQDEAGGNRIQVLSTAPNVRITGQVRAVTTSSAAGSRVASFYDAFATENVMGIMAAVGTSEVSAGAASCVGLGGRAYAIGAATTKAYGLSFLAGTTSAAVAALAEAFGCWADVLILNRDATDARGFYTRGAYLVLSATLTNNYAFYGALAAYGTNRYGLYLADISGGTIARLLEIGATPYLRLLGSGEWTPAANETPAYLAEGVTPTLRQIKWKDGAAIGAGDKVMVLG